METIIQQLKQRETLVNRLISQTFEYINCQEFGGPSTVKTNLNAVMNRHNEQCSLIRLQLNKENKEDKESSETFYYLKEDELKNEHPCVYQLNHQLADLEAVGYIKDESLHLDNNTKQISLKTI